VNATRLISPWPAMIVSAALALGAPTGVRAIDPPPPPAPPAPPSPPSAQPDSNADLDAQLEAARRKLEQAAHEVARLSAQLSSTAIDQVMPFLEPGRAIIGVELEPAPGKAGARVRAVSPGGPAAQAGIRAGDVIVAVNGTEIRGEQPTRAVVRIMRGIEPDSRVSVRVLRDGKPREFLVTARPGPVFATAHGLPDLHLALPDLQGAFLFRRPLMDMELATLTPRLGSYFGADKGVLVVRAPADGALKLEDGDVILAIDGREPTSASHATRILGSYQPGEKIELRILRQHKTQQLEARLPERSGPAHREQDFGPVLRDRDVVYFDQDAVRLEQDARHLDREVQRRDRMPHDAVPPPPKVVIVGGDDI
jgi:PDZ domain